MKTALITGITGQDGSYLAEFLLNKGYEVVGLSRSLQYIDNIKHIQKDIVLYTGDVIDSSLTLDIIKAHRPDEIYNFAAVSHIQDCWRSPLYTVQANSMAPIQIMDMIAKLGLNTRFLQATSREIFGNYGGLINESTPYSTENPYAVSKLYGHLMIENYRQNYSIFACSAILFNHESPRRPVKFVTRKVTNFVANLRKNPNAKLKLGNMDAKRDWGYAGDFVEGMWLQLQQEEPEDFIFATGILFSIADLCEIAFAHEGLDYRNYVEVDESFIRKSEVKAPVGDYTKAKDKLNWEPKVSFPNLIKMMIEGDK